LESNTPRCYNFSKSERQDAQRTGPGNIIPGTATLKVGRRFLGAIGVILSQPEQPIGMMPGRPPHCLRRSGIRSRAHSAAASRAIFSRANLPPCASSAQGELHGSGAGTADDATAAPAHTAIDYCDFLNSKFLISTSTF
jgi:hypothetical protein